MSAGVRHNIINSSQQQPLKLYTIYSPPEHHDGTIYKNKAEALATKKSIITSRAAKHGTNVHRCITCCRYQHKKETYGPNTTPKRKL